ncbi:UNVERIFIED_CONTAM: E3 ubiquitin-protein ligase RNFT1 [Sesamum radiatum]|uniref:E3 ubiquitin-protein ligase RNFT1 n=1 Tax=Sesamum radiatum TaxID=300843 RepID=A0AAW2KCC1_SESRA
METSDSAAVDLDSGSPSNGGGTIRIVQFPALGFLQSPISSLLEYSGFIRVRPDYAYSETRPLVSDSTNASVNVQSSGSNSASVNGNGGVDGSGDSNSGDSSNNGEVSIRIIGEQDRVGDANNGESGGNGVGLGAEGSVVGPDEVNGNGRVSSDNDNNNREALSYQRYDMQQAARWIEQILPFSLLLLVVFIRQHLQDTMARQTAMVLKLVLLMYYKNGRGHNFRRQGQMLTLVEYTLLLYRALLPTPVWYRFFLNKDYGSLFSSLTTGLYLTFKLTSIVEKVQSFFAALKALSRKVVHYGSYATPEQVNAAGDLCAICQEKMHVPVLLRCKHIFCEDCVSEWFERERTCPLCRALVRPADLQSYGDGSTSLFFQLF